ETGEVGHGGGGQGLVRAVRVDVAGGVQPQGGLAAHAERLVEGVAAAVVEVEGVEEDVQLVLGQAAFEQVVEQVDVVRRTEAVEGDDALLPDQRQVDVVAVAFVHQRFVVEEDGHL